MFDDEHLAAKPVYGTYGAGTASKTWQGGRGIFVGGILSTLGVPFFGLVR